MRLFQTRAVLPAPGITDQAAYDSAREILIKMGVYFQAQDDYLDSYIDARRDGQSDGEALLSVANSAGEAEDTVRASLVRQVEALLPEYEGSVGEQRLRAYLSAWRAAGTQ